MDDAPWPVIASAPPLVFVLRATEADLPAISRAAQLVIVRREGGDPELYGDRSVLDDLDAGARLFVEAWMTAPLAKGARPGDGLAWDAEGFEPPDGPPGQ
jgi:hypothetical protein